MARSVRIEVAGGFYHVMARGNRREKIFLDDADREHFLQALGEACAMTGWRVHAWVLLSNHYHLMLETPEPNLVAGMQWLQNTVTRRYNVRHRAWGRVFGDRYKAVVVEGRSGYYYETLMDYIHLNPVRAGLVRLGQKESLLDYGWSSLRAGYGVPARRRAKWLVAEEGLAVFGLADTTAGRRQFVERLERRAREEGARGAGVVRVPKEMDGRGSHLRRGWYWGSQLFGEKMLRLAERTLKRIKARSYRSSAVRETHGLKQAERWLKEGLAVAGLREGDLDRLKGSDPRKVVLAQLLWRGTTVSQEWLAQKLKMRSAANVSQLLRRARGKRVPVPAALKVFVDQAGRS